MEAIMESNTGALIWLICLFLFFAVVSFLGFYHGPVTVGVAGIILILYFAGILIQTNERFKKK